MTRRSFGPDDRSAAVGTRRPGVAVIVVNHNGLHHLRRCLPALAATSGPSIEICVVDNGSADGSAEWLEANWPDVTVVALGENLGFGAANRVGVERTDRHYVALLNNDTVVQPGWLSPLLEVLENDPTIAAACSTLALLDHPDVANARGGGMTWLGYGFDRDYGFPLEPTTAPSSARVSEVLFPTAAAMLIRRDDFVGHGGFDQSYFMYHEDVDLGWRLWLLGRRVVVHRDSVVYHAYGGTTHSLRGQSWRARLGMRHNLRTLIKHYQLKTLVRAAIGIAKVWWQHRAFAQATAVLGWNLAHLPGTLAARRQLQRRRKFTDLELIERKLISGAGYPPDRPELPASPNERPVKNVSVRPAEDSARQRLGWGWYRRERTGTKWTRWTCGDARASLFVTPGAMGRVVARLRLAPGAVSSTVTLVANGRRAEAACRGEAWHDVSVDAEADGEGLIDVRIATPPVVPHELAGNWDFRLLGCAVDSIRFFVSDPPARESAPLVSVLIPTFNRVHELIRTLEALRLQTWDRLEVVVVDDGSTDTTLNELERWADAHRGQLSLSWFTQANQGPASARNLALVHATGEYVLFLGDDTCPAPDLVEAHVRAHGEIGEPCAVVGFTDWDRERMRVTSFLEHVNRNGEQFGYGLFGDGADIPFTCLYTSNLSLPRHVLDDAPFDTAFRRAAWEDAELGYRLCRRGLRIVYRSEARTSHYHPMTMAKFLQRQTVAGQEAATVYALHPELSSSDVMPSFRPPRAVRLLGGLVRRLTGTLSWLDSSGVPLPARLYRLAALSFYFAGRASAERAAARAR